MSTPQMDDLQIRALVQQSERAWASGQRNEAERLLAQAKAAAPEHALVLNASGVQELHRGNLDAARTLIEKAVAKDASNPAFWINLASICRRSSLRAEEMQALERALAIDPRHLLALLQKASLFDLMGKPRAAATTYHNALKTIPAGAQLPESLRAPLQRATQAVNDNNTQLAAFIDERTREIAARHSQAEQDRFRHSIDALLGKRRIFTPQPTFLHFPKLPAEEFYPRQQFPWLNDIEAATAEIRGEFERVFAEDSDKLEPYIAYPDGVPLDQWKELNHSRKWSVFYLWRNGKPVTDHLARCPKTAALLERTPKVDIAGVGPTAFFSILDAHSHIPAHTGVTNTRLVVHVPLVIPSGCRFRVGSDTREWRPGSAWVFDDTIEHEAWNDSDVPRAVLIFDIWNPYMSTAEQDLVRASVAGITEYYGDQSPMADSH
jgi:aspartate beta-hydroxylase